MTRPLVVLRPEPGNAATVARIAGRGSEPIALPLFAVRPCAWTPPDPADFDALLLTSANAVRHAGPGLRALAHLPVVAVGPATAEAATAAGLNVALEGDTDGVAAVALAQAAGFARLLRLTGREHILLGGVTDCIVYASDVLTPPADRLAQVAGGVALLHSPRAARVFASVLDEAGIGRAAVRLAALSPAVAAAAGSGWGGTVIAARPIDAALVEVAARAAIDP